MGAPTSRRDGRPHSRGGGPKVAAITCALLAALGCADNVCEGEKCHRFTPVPDASAPIVERSDAGAPRLTQAESACVMQSIEAEPGKERPVDIIFVIDNSGSMTEEIIGVQQNIN